MDRDRVLEAARTYCERHLGDVAGDYEDEETLLACLHDEAYTLAHDGAVAAGADMALACDVAAEVARGYGRS